jgi:hypothetical protein
MSISGDSGGLRHSSFVDFLPDTCCSYGRGELLGVGAELAERVGGQVLGDAVDDELVGDRAWGDGDCACVGLLPCGRRGVELAQEGFVCPGLD